MKITMTLRVGRYATTAPWHGFQSLARRGACGVVIYTRRRWQVRRGELFRLADDRRGERAIGLIDNASEQIAVQSVAVVAVGLCAVGERRRILQDVWLSSCVAE